MLEAVERGEAAITPATAARILAESSPGRTGPRDQRGTTDLERLTEREIDVLRLRDRAVIGNKEIAARLGISENTVKFHLRHILEKLHAGAAPRLRRAPSAQGLIEPAGETPAAGS